MWHNNAVLNGLDVQEASSSKPLGATSEAIEPVSRPAAFDSPKERAMPGTMPADKTTALPVDAAAAPVKPATIREFERALKSLGYSQREATTIAKGGFKAIGTDDQEDLSELVAALAKTHYF